MRRLALSLLLLAACGGDDAAAPIDAPMRQTTFGGARPATLVVPGSYDPATPTPLVLVLHGYSTNTTYAAPLLQLTAAASTAGFLMIAPAGTVDSTGNHFWNATDACCNMENSQVDDVAYQLPWTCACSRNSPPSISAMNAGSVTKW